MTYTYEDFLRAANTEGMMDRFSADDLKIAQTSPEYGLSMLSLQKDAANATTEDARLLAQEAMNQLRTNYSATVSQPANSAYQAQINKLLGQVTDTGPFEYENADVYQSTLKDLMESKPFEYDHTKDSTYQAMAKTYLREGQRTQQDVLAQVAAANGGNTPTSAVTAATQAGDYYNAQLADRIPDLQQQAYQQYLNAAAQKLGILGAMDTDRQLDLQEHLGNQNILLQQLAALQGQAGTDYNRMQESYDRLSQLITSFGYEPTAEELTAAGMTEQQAQMYKNYYITSTRTSGRGGKTTKSSNVDLNKILELAGDDSALYAYLNGLYIQGKIDSTELDTWMDAYSNELYAPKQDSGPIGASALMGALKGALSGLRDRLKE